MAGLCYHYCARLQMIDAACASSFRQLLPRTSVRALVDSLGHRCEERSSAAGAERCGSVCFRTCSISDRLRPRQNPGGRSKAAASARALGGNTVVGMSTCRTAAAQDEDVGTGAEEGLTEVSLQPCRLLLVAGFDRAHFIPLFFLARSLWPKLNLVATTGQGGDAVLTCWGSKPTNNGQFLSAVTQVCLPLSCAQQLQGDPTGTVITMATDILSTRTSAATGMFLTGSL